MEVEGWRSGWSSRIGDVWFLFWGFEFLADVELVVKWVGGIENEVLGRILGDLGYLQMLGFGRTRRSVLRLTRSLLMMESVGLNR